MIANIEKLPVRIDSELEANGGQDPAAAFRQA
jgi:hypothetical protein